MSSRILIVGGGKSGTTALFHRVHAGLSATLGRDAATLFEPKSLDALGGFTAPAGVVKLLLQRYYEMANQAFLSAFDRSVLIVRDPRDNIVSGLLWSVATRINSLDPGQREGVLSLFYRKQNDPGSISLVQMLQGIEAFGVSAFGGVPALTNQAYLAHTFMCDSQARQFHLLRYEDFVDGRLTDLEAYLGFSLPRQDAAGSAVLARVRRTAGQGSWRRWFLAEDFDRLVDRRKLEEMGYPDERPREQHEPIPGSECVGYIQRVAGTVAMAGIAPIRPDDLRSPRAWLTTAHELMRSETLDQAAEVAARRLAESPEDPAALRLMAGLKARQSDLDGAVLFARRWLHGSPDDQDAARACASTLMCVGRSQEATDVLRGASRGGGHAVRAALAQTLLALRVQPEADALLLSLSDEPSMELWALECLIKSREAQGDLTGAAELAPRLWNASSGERATALRCARLLARAGMADDAISLLQGVPDTLQRDEELIPALCSLLVDAGRLGEANALVERSQPLTGPSSPPVLLRAFAEVRSAFADHAGAAAILDALWRGPSPDVQTATGLAAALAASGRHGEGIALLREAFARLPRDPQTIVELAAAFLRHGSPEDVLVILDAAGPAYAMRRKVRHARVAAICLAGRPEMLASFSDDDIVQATTHSEASAAAGTAMAIALRRYDLATRIITEARQLLHDVAFAQALIAALRMPDAGAAILAWRPQSSEVESAAFCRAILRLAASQAGASREPDGADPEEFWILRLNDATALAAQGGAAITQLHPGGAARVTLRLGRAGPVQEIQLPLANLFGLDLRAPLLTPRFVITARAELLTSGVVHNPAKQVAGGEVIARTADAAAIRPLRVGGRLAGSSLLLGGGRRPAASFFRFMFNLGLQVPLVQAWIGFQAFDRILVQQPLSSIEHDWLIALGAPVEKLEMLDPDVEAVEVERLCVLALPFRFEQGRSGELSGSRHALTSARRQLLGDLPSPRRGAGRRLFLAAEPEGPVLSSARDLQPVLDDFDVETVPPGPYSVEERIRLLSQAELVIGPWAPELSSAFLAPSHAHVIQLGEGTGPMRRAYVEPSLLLGQTVWRMPATVTAGELRSTFESILSTTAAEAS